MATLRQNRAATATILVIVALALAVSWSRGLEPRPGNPALTADDGEERTRAGSEPGSSEAPGRPVPTAAARAQDSGAVPQAPAAAPATVEVHVHVPGAASDRTVRLRAVAEDSRITLASTVCHARDGEAVGSLDVPPEEWHRVEVVVADLTGAAAHLPGRRLRLGAGERHRLDLECRGEIVALRVTGPTARLLPRLWLEVTDHADPGAAPFEVPLDAEGTVACYLAGRGSAGLVLTRTNAGGDAPTVPLATEAGDTAFVAGGGSIELLPLEPVLGIEVRRAGRAQPAAISLDGRAPPRALVPCTITTRQRVEAAEALTFRAAIGGERRCALDRVDRSTDLWSVDADLAEPLGGLAVRYEPDTGVGTVPPLAAFPFDGGAPTSLVERRALLEPGDYRLAWLPPAAGEWTAAERVRVLAGETTELRLAPRALERWTVRIEDIPPGEPLLTLHCLGVRSLGASQDGAFRIDLGRSPRTGETARVDSWHHKTSFAATFTAVDAAGRTATLDTGHVLWTRLACVPLRGGPARIGLLDAADQPLQGLLEADLLPLPEGGSRRGYVLEDIDGQRQLTCWFEVAAGAAEVTLRADGRWATLEMPADCTRASVVLTGPSGRPVELRLREPGRRQPLFVAAGTTAIEVDAIPGGRQGFDPGLREFVVR